MIIESTDNIIEGRFSLLTPIVEMKIGQVSGTTFVATKSISMIEKAHGFHWSIKVKRLEGLQLQLSCFLIGHVVNLAQKNGPIRRRRREDRSMIRPSQLFDVLPVLNRGMREQLDAHPHGTIHPLAEARETNRPVHTTGRHHGQRRSHTLLRKGGAYDGGIEP